MFLGDLGFVWLSSICTKKFQNSMPWFLFHGTQKHNKGKLNRKQKNGVCSYQCPHKCGTRPFQHQYIMLEADVDASATNRQLNSHALLKHMDSSIQPGDKADFCACAITFQQRCTVNQAVTASNPLFTVIQSLNVKNFELLTTLLNELSIKKFICEWIFVVVNLACMICCGY